MFKWKDIYSIYIFRIDTLSHFPAVFTPFEEISWSPGGKIQKCKKKNIWLIILFWRPSMYFRRPIQNFLLMWEKSFHLYAKLMIYQWKWFLTFAIGNWRLRFKLVLAKVFWDQAKVKVILHQHLLWLFRWVCGWCSTTSLRWMRELRWNRGGWLFDFWWLGMNIGLQS